MKLLYTLIILFAFSFAEEKWEYCVGKLKVVKSTPASEVVSHIKNFQMTLRLYYQINNIIDYKEMFEDGYIERNWNYKYDISDFKISESAEVSGKIKIRTLEPIYGDCKEVTYNLPERVVSFCGEVVDVSNDIGIFWTIDISKDYNASYSIYDEFPLTKHFNHLGSDGWELIKMDNDSLFYFKRKVLKPITKPLKKN